MTAEIWLEQWRPRAEPLISEVAANNGVPELVGDGAHERVGSNFRSEGQIVDITSEQTIVRELGPSIRSASGEDLEALVRVELSAYKDVYGEDPASETIEAVRAKFDDRIDLLGDWIRVLEHPDDGVYGMVVMCPTHLSADDFVDKSMTDSATLHDVFDPEGDNAYIVNMAILSNDHDVNSLDMFRDASQFGVERGLSTAYFESRLPRFQRWLDHQTTVDGIESPTDAEVDAYAEQYWQLTKEVNGEDTPIDPLLAMYVKYGSRPLRLVRNAWNEDHTSRAYGVLCSFTPSADFLNSSETDEPDQTIDKSESIGTRVMERLRLNRKRIATASILGSVALGVPHVVDNWDRVVDEGPVYAASYGLFTAAYLSGGITRLASGVGRRVSAWMHSNHDEEAEPSGLVKKVENASLYANGIGAVGMAGTAVAATIALLPPRSWPAPITLAGLDAAASIWSRRELLHSDREPSDHSL